MRVLVCGGRDYADAARVSFVLDHYHAQRPFSVLIHGAARGADALAGVWATLRGVPILDFPAKWDDLEALPCLVKYRRDGVAYNALAGSNRNAQMIAEGKPEIVIAFPGGRGTRNMLMQARDCRIDTLEIP